ETPSGMLNAIGLQGPGVDALIRDYAPKWEVWDFPVLVNINGESASEYGELAARLDGVPGVAGFEINISCPNVEQGGMYFGNDPRAAASVTEAVRRRTSLPVWVKLTPMVSDIGVIARAVAGAGADALSAVNTFVGMSMDLNAYRPRSLTPPRSPTCTTASRRFSRSAVSPRSPTCRDIFRETEWSNARSRDRSPRRCRSSRPSTGHYWRRDR